MKIVILTVAVALLAAHALAALPIPDFKSPGDVLDDIQAALHLGFEVWTPPLPEANELAKQTKITPDDFLALTFLADISDLSLKQLWRMRESGASFARIIESNAIPWDAVVVRPTKKHGPPYGKAWGYWKKRGGRPGQAFSLTDAELVDMVHVRTLVKATGMAVDDVIDQLEAGQAFSNWAATHYRHKHKVKGPKHSHLDKDGPEKKHGHDKDADTGRGKGKGHGKGKNK